MSINIAKKLRMLSVCTLTVAGKTIFRSFNMSANIVVSTRVNQLSPAWSFWLPSWATYSRICWLSRKCCILWNAQWCIITQLLCLAYTCTCKSAVHLPETKIRKEITIKKWSSTRISSALIHLDGPLITYCIQSLLWFCECECVCVWARACMCLHEGAYVHFSAF